MSRTEPQESVARSKKIPLDDLPQARAQQDIVVCAESGENICGCRVIVGTWNRWVASVHHRASERSRQFYLSGPQGGRSA